jgi:hypothetical protein
LEPSSTTTLVCTLTTVAAGADGGGWAIVKDLVLAGAAGVGAIVAVVGLSTWKRQLRGRTEYDLAKRILRLCYEYRDTVAAARHPWMELPSESDGEAADMDLAHRRYLGTERAYEARWERIRAVRAELYPEMLEAEVLWDAQLAELLEPLFGLERDLFLAIEDELSVRNPDLHPNDTQLLREPEAIKQRKRILYGRFGDTDEFDAKFKDGLARVGTFLKERLRK